MVIQCKQCETTYNFDDAALQSGQVEVRCVRCKNVFTIDSTSTVTAPAAQLLPEPDPIVSTEPTMPTEELQPKIAIEPEPLPEWDTDSDAFSFAPSDDFSFTDDPEATPATDELMPTDEEPETPDFTFENLEPEPEVIEPPTSSSPFAPPTTEEPTTATEPEEKVSNTPQLEKRKTSKLLILLLLIILMVAGAYGYFFVTLGTTDVTKMIQNIQQQLNPPTSGQQGEIRINTTQSYYVDNAAAGQLFVIQGVATNDHETAQSELCVKGTLYQKKGAPLIHQSAYCGNIIATEELKSAPMANLANQMTNPFGTALSNVNIGPGQSLPFMIVFSDLPKELNEFSVEPVSSKAASN